MLDLSLAIGHHLLIFAIFGIICAEVWAVRPGLIGLLSLPPTLAFLRWRKSVLPPSEADIRTVGRYVHLELGLFVLLPVFAAAMARGYGQF
jgi:uncharacterized membrane protein